MNCKAENFLKNFPMSPFPVDLIIVPPFGTKEGVKRMPEPTPHFAMQRGLKKSRKISA
jgi:hypothetical protein